MSTGPARIPLVVTAVGGLAFVALAWWLVPWHPVPGGTPRAVPVSEVFTPAQVRTGEDVERWSRVWGYSSLAVSLAVLLWLALGRTGRRLVARLPGPWWVVTVLAVVVVDLAVRLATLPFSAAEHQHLLHAGLTQQGWAGFARDVAVGLLVETVGTGLAVLVLVACARRWRTWWAVVAGVLVGALVLVGSFVYPLLVEPLFNQFTPLPHGSLRTQVLALADQEGVHVDDVLVADASRRTTTLNAYVSGFGSTRRVVLYDNLVDDEPPPVVLSVVAHELAHAKYDDVVTGSVLGVAGSVAGVGLLGLVLAAGERRRGGARLGDPRSVPLVLALVAVGSVLAAPLQNAVSRQIETRADVTALRATHDGATFEQLQRQLALRAKSDPTPPWLEQVWFGSHPTVLERVAIARRLTH